MSKTLNLELFKPGFIFHFKGNKHVILKDYHTEVLVVNLDYDDCESIKNYISGWEDEFESLSDVIYKLDYADILEDVIHSDKLRGEEVNLDLLIEEEVC